MANILLLTYGNESSIELVKSISSLNKHSVWGCHYDTLNAGRAYLTSSKILEVASPSADPARFVQDVEGIIARFGIDSVVYTNCKMMKFVHERWDQLAGG